MIETVINSEYRNPSWHVHWYPVNPNFQGNFIEENGPLHKYDQAFGASSRSYEASHNIFVSGWQGHCDGSAMVSALLYEPGRDVVYNGVTFTKKDIAGLLVQIVKALPYRIHWFGKRYPEGHISEPSPQSLYNQLKQWTSAHRQVIFDVERNFAVWNYPYSKVVFNFDQQQMEATSTGFPEENRTFKFDWNANQWLGEIKKGMSDNIDFAWYVEPTEDLLNINSYPVENSRRMNPFFNPEVSPRKVGEIYLRSLNL